jgi:hypothetical protein
MSVAISAGRVLGLSCKSKPLLLLLLEPRSRHGIRGRRCSGAAAASQTISPGRSAGRASFALRRGTGDEELNLSTIMASYKGEKGQPPYHPAMMWIAALWLCGRPLLLAPDRQGVHGAGGFHGNCRKPMKLFRTIPMLGALPRLHVFHCASCNHTTTKEQKLSPPACDTPSSLVGDTELSLRRREPIEALFLLISE